MWGLPTHVLGLLSLARQWQSGFLVQGGLYEVLSNAIVSPKASCIFKNGFNLWSLTLRIEPYDGSWIFTVPRGKTWTTSEGPTH